MADDDWFRRKTWTAVDREEFTTRNRRSRGNFHKAQYARIQAFELEAVNTQETLQGAIELLEMILSNWRDDAQLAAVYHQHAKCMLRINRPGEAIASFRQVFEAQRKNPGSTTTAHLDFGWMAICTPSPELYDEVLVELDKFKNSSGFGFPIYEYLDSAVRAIIHQSLGDSKRASAFSKQALSAAAKSQSDFSRHSHLGLVTNIDPSIHSQLQAIAGRP